MADRAKHLQRVKELEEFGDAIEDVGEPAQLDDRADMNRIAVQAQIEENVYWANLPEGKPIPFYESDEAALADIREKARKTTEAGTLPKQKPLLYRLDFHEMTRQRLKAALETTEGSKREAIVKELYKISGKIEECADWLIVQDAHGDWGTLVVGKDGREPKMPTFGTKSEVDMHIQKRHMGIGFTEEEELKPARKKVYKDIAKAHADAVSEENAKQTRED